MFFHKFINNNLQMIRSCHNILLTKIMLFFK